MTDTQMSAAINTLAVPRMPGGAVNNARVSHLDQWALTTARTYPVQIGNSAATEAAAFPLLDEPASRLVSALRIVCGGSVVTTRSMFAQADDEFPIVQGYNAMMSQCDTADNDRPTHLMTPDLPELRRTYLALAEPQVRDPSTSCPRAQPNWSATLANRHISIKISFIVDVNSPIQIKIPSISLAF
jgi:hypothetical protein